MARKFVPGEIKYNLFSINIKKNISKWKKKNIYNYIIIYYIIFKFYENIK